MSKVGKSEPFIRTIVRGKVKATVEFRSKLDSSIDECGNVRIEVERRFSFAKFLYLYFKDLYFWKKNIKNQDLIIVV